MTEETETSPPRSRWDVAAQVALWLLLPSVAIVVTFVVLDMIPGIDGLDRAPWSIIGLISLGIWVVGGLVVFGAEFAQKQTPHHARDDDAAPTLPRWGYIAGMVWLDLVCLGVPTIQAGKVLGLDEGVRAALALAVYPALAISGVVWLFAVRIRRRREKAAGGPFHRLDWARSGHGP